MLIKPGTPMTMKAATDGAPPYTTTGAFGTLPACGEARLGALAASGDWSDRALTAYFRRFAIRKNPPADFDVQGYSVLP